MLTIVQKILIEIDTTLLRGVGAVLILVQFILIGLDPRSAAEVKLPV